MLKVSLLEQESFWKVVKYLGNLQTPTSINTICRELELTQTELKHYTNFMQEVGFSFEWGESKITPQTFQKVFTIQLNLLEWIQFQAHFPTLSQCSNKPFHEDIKVKLIELENKNQDYDLFTPLSTLEQALIPEQPNTIEIVESFGAKTTDQLQLSIFEKECVTVDYNQKSYTVYPLKIVYFEGGLNLIAEHVSESILMNFDLPGVTKVQMENREYHPQYSPLEVEAFVSSLTAMHEKVVRLVLKITSHENFQINLNNAYFHNPCLFTNPEGDYIWAATLEPSPAVFEWLCELGRYVEILDPTSFKREFLRYCEDKLKKIA